MSFISMEESQQSGAPVELYDFCINLTHWHYTSADHDITYSGQDYLARPVARAAIEMSDEVARAGLTISVSRDDAFVGSYLLGVGGRLASVTILRGHEADGEFVTIWKGRVGAIVFKNSLAEIQCESIFTSLKRQGLRAKYQHLCRFALYGEGCNVSEGDYLFTGSISVVSGLTLTVPGLDGQADGYYFAGLLKYGDFVWRMIEGHAGNVITVDRSLPGAAYGDTVLVYPGCDHTSDACRDKFNNLLNFGGFEFIPLVNPFSTLGNNLLG